MRLKESEKDSKKQNQQKIKQENLNQKTKKENSEKEFYSRKGDKKNKISDVNIQKSIHLYKIFNLNYGCTIEELKDSYRKLLKKYHPDKFYGDAKKLQIAQDVVKKLNVAYNYFEEKYNK